MKIINLKDRDDDGIGKGGNGRVGFQQNRGEGSGEVRQRSQGGGGGGNHYHLPSQTGKLPPPSNIQASIPTSPPIHTPSLPVAGIDIDPALWKDIKAPVFGDPRSTSTAQSKGPGDGGGIGSNQGLGIGEGHGPGVGPGTMETWATVTSRQVVAVVLAPIETMRLWNGAFVAAVKWSREPDCYGSLNRSTRKKHVAIRSLGQ